MRGLLLSFSFQIKKIPEESGSRLDITCPEESVMVHEATLTKSVTKDGMVHLSKAALPSMTCSLFTSTK